MTGRGGARPATTPQGRESPLPRAARAAKWTNRRRRFDGMERIFGEAEDSPSDGAGILVSCGRTRHQVPQAAVWACGVVVAPHRFAENLCFLKDFSASLGLRKRSCLRVWDRTGSWGVWMARSTGLLWSASRPARLRKAAERTVDGLWNAIGQISLTFSPQECKDYFNAAGYNAT